VVHLRLWIEGPSALYGGLVQIAYPPVPLFMP